MAAKYLFQNVDYFSPDGDKRLFGIGLFK